MNNYKKKYLKYKQKYLSLRKQLGGSSISETIPTFLLYDQNVRSCMDASQYIILDEGDQIEDYNVYQIIQNFKKNYNRINGTQITEDKITLHLITGKRDRNSSIIPDHNNKLDDEKKIDKEIKYCFKINIPTGISGEQLRTINISSGRRFKKLVDYEGETINHNIPHGKGILKDNEGYIFDGIFNNGYFVDGEIFYINGDYYKGTLKNNFLDNGIYKFADGTIKKGTFENGLLVNGEIIYLNDIVKKGTFENGLLVNGEIIYPSGIVKKGTFENGLLVNGEVTNNKGDYFKFNY